MFGGVVEFLLGEAEGFGVVAQDGVGGLLDALAEVLDALAGALFGLAGGLVHALAEEFAGDLEGLGVGVRGILHALVESAGHLALADELFAHLLQVGGVLLAEVAECVVELAGEKGFGAFGLLGEIGGALDEIGEAGLLGGELLQDLLAVGGAGEGLLALVGVVLLVVEFAFDFLLGAGEVAGFGAEFAGGLVEGIGVLAAEFLAHFLELALGAGSGSEGLGDLTLTGGLGGLLHLLSGLLELLTLLGVGGRVLRTFHPLLEFVGVGQVLALFLLETLQFALEFLLLLFVRGLEGGLQFLETLVHLLLTTGEFLQAVDGLLLLALLFLLRGTGLTLVLVSVLGLGEVEFIDLLLVALALRLGLRLRLLVASAGNLGLAGLELDDGLVGGLFGSEGLLEEGGILGGLVEEFDGPFHLGDGVGPEGALAGIALFRGGRAGLFEGFLGGVADDLEVVGVGGPGGSGGALAARGGRLGGLLEAGGLGEEVVDRTDRSDRTDRTDR